jgi:Flp pilus assembly CpaE family ATPase
MFNALLFAGDAVSGQLIERLAEDSKLLTICKILKSFPSNYELTVLLNTHHADLIFLDLSRWEAAMDVVSLIRTIEPRMAIIGFGAGWASHTGSLSEQAGITELLISPVTTKDFEVAVCRAVHKLRSGTQENLLAFLPAKAGSGCTTVALNTAGCLVGLGKKVLMIEGDLNSGVLPILVNASAPGSLLDVLEKSSQIDYSLWSSCTVHRLGLDLLMAGRAKPLPSWNNYYHLLEYVQSRYDNVIVDLPEVANDATEEILKRARFAFIVCTPELPALKLAQRRCRELESRDVLPSRIGIIVNRCHDTDVKERDIEQTLEHGVAAIFPNDYPAVQNATINSRMVDPATQLGKTFLSLAKLVAGVPELESEAAPKSVLHYLKSLLVT